MGNSPQWKPGPIGPLWLVERIRGDQTVIIDGAGGSELEARGVPMIGQGWASLAQLEYPGILQELHEDYLRAGAQVITTNTFAAGRHLLEPGGMGDKVADVHRRSVEIAMQARKAVGTQAVIAGSISCYMADDTDPEWLARLDETYSEQAELLADAGVDLIMLEMMQQPELALPAARAAIATALPVWLGLTARRRADGTLTVFDSDQHPLVDTIEALAGLPFGVVSVMHTAVPDVGPSLHLIRRHWDGPLGVYPESGYFEEPSWQFVDIIEPDALVDAARSWRAKGVQVLGGCCGLGVEHISALNSEFGEPTKATRSGPRGRRRRRRPARTAAWLSGIASAWWVLILIASLVSGGDSAASDAGIEGAVVGLLAAANIAGTVLAFRNRLTGSRLLLLAGLAFSVSALFMAGRNQLLAMIVSGGPFIAAGLLYRAATRRSSDT